MAVHEKVWMAGRASGENSYYMLGFSFDEQEVLALCEQKEDFVAVMDTQDTEIGTPLEGYYPLWDDEEGEKECVNKPVTSAVSY